MTNITHPVRLTRSMAFYRNKMRDGTIELMAFFETPITGGSGMSWCPMISVWAMTDDLDESQEDVITVNGMHFGYCISENTPADYADIKPIDDISDVNMPTYMLAIGMLTSQVL